jgi:hypothetical protein
MSKSHSSLRFNEFTKAAAAGAFAGAIALSTPTQAANHRPAATGSVQINSANAKWFVNTNITFSSTSSAFGMSEASLHTANGTREDAFDGVLAWHVNSAPPAQLSYGGYRSPGGTVSVTANSVTGTTQSLAGLNVSGQLYFSTTKPVVRSMLLLQNPTGADLTVTVDNDNNLGSDSSTLVVATSSGDATFDSSDNWFVSGQDSQNPPQLDPTLDPVLTFAYQDALAPVRSTLVGTFPAGGDSDNPNFRYTVTVPAGATRRLIIFVQLSDTAAHAEADAPLFNSGATVASTDYLTGLTPQELAEVVNWNFIAQPTLALSSGINPSDYGQGVTFTGTLTNASASPTGTLTICADDATCAAPTVSCTASVSSTSAGCALTGLSAGSHSIVALYSGDTNNAAATSTAVTQQVNQANQTLTFGATPSIVVGGSGTVTATSATPNSGNPITYSSTSTDCTVDANSGLVQGVHAGTNDCTINASQNGNTNFAAGNASLTFSIGSVAASVSLSASPNPSHPGDAVTFTATVSGASPSGTVSFYDNGVLIGTGALNGGTPDQASFTTTSLSNGSHSITATYAGDGNNSSASSAAVTESVTAVAAPSVVALPTLATLAQWMLGGLLAIAGVFVRRRWSNEK